MVSQTEIAPVAIATIANNAGNVIRTTLQPPDFTKPPKGARSRAYYNAHEDAVTNEMLVDEVLAELAGCAGEPAPVVDHPRRRVRRRVIISGFIFF
jgi:hypothetical protein